MKLYSILDEMPFGKYRGDLVGTVIEEDASYISWMLNNTDFRLDDAAYAYFKENVASQ